MKIVKPDQCGGGTCASCSVGQKNGLSEIAENLVGPFEASIQKRQLTQRGLVLERSRMLAWDHVFCVSKGILKLVKREADGTETILRLYSSGDLVGLPSVLAEAELGNSILGDGVIRLEALSDFEACALPAAEIKNLLLNDSRFSQRVLSVLAHEVLKDQVRITELASKPVRARMASLLVRLAEDHGKTVHSTVRLGAKLSRQELASLAGVALETAVRALQSLRKEKILAFDGREIIVLDMEGLKQAAA